MKRTEASTAWRMRVNGSAAGSMAAACARAAAAHRAHELGEERFLVLEVPVEEALGDARLLADVDDAGGRSPAGEERRRLVEELLLALPALVRVPAGVPARPRPQSTTLTEGSMRAMLPWCRQRSDDRIERRAQRNPKWRNPPLRIEMAECINCDACLRHCPPQFGAIFNHGPDVVIIPELCSGCDKCLPACPVNCIYPFPEWEQAGYPGEWWDVPLSDDDPYRRAGPSELGLGPVTSHRLRPGCRAVLGAPCPAPRRPAARCACTASAATRARCEAWPGVRRRRLRRRAAAACPATAPTRRGHATTGWDDWAGAAEAALLSARPARATGRRRRASRWAASLALWLARATRAGRDRRASTRGPAPAARGRSTWSTRCSRRARSVMPGIGRPTSPTPTAIDIAYEETPLRPLRVALRTGSAALGPPARRGARARAVLTARRTTSSIRRARTSWPSRYGGPVARLEPRAELPRRHAGLRRATLLRERAVAFGLEVCAALEAAAVSVAPWLSPARARLHPQPVLGRHPHRQPAAPDVRADDRPGRDRRGLAGRPAASSRRASGPATRWPSIALWAVPAGMIGARLYHVITDWELFRDDLVRRALHLGGRARDLGRHRRRGRRRERGGPSGMGPALGLAHRTPSRRRCRWPRPSGGSGTGGTRSCSAGRRRCRGGWRSRRQHRRRLSSSTPRSTRRSCTRRCGTCCWSSC